MYCILQYMGYPARGIKKLKQNGGFKKKTERERVSFEHQSDQAEEE